MTTKKANKTSLLIALCAVFSVAAPLCPAQSEEPSAEQPPVAPEKADASKNPRRPGTFQDALSAAGDDGVIAFCYGPDWNQRSVRMLKSFWNTENLEKATGQAMLVAVPIYENPSPEQEEEANRISAGMPPVPFSVCPTVMMVDKNGTMYANLPGSDFLGDEKGATGIQNIAQKLAAHRKAVELMNKAATLQGVEKAKVLGEIGELPIEKPSGLVDMLKEADPKDTTGLIRRNEHSALQFLYKQMDTKDGFLKQDFHTTLKDLMVESMKIVNDTALRTEDRQAAYCLLIGQARREEGGSKRLKDMINANMKIDPNSFYGRAMPRLLALWSQERANESVDERRTRRNQEKEDEKKRRQHDREIKKTERNVNVE